MHSRSPHTTPASDGHDPSRAWRALLALSRLSRGDGTPGDAACYAVGDDGALRGVAHHDRGAVLRWCPTRGWAPAAALPRQERDLLDLYLPLCQTNGAATMAVGHLGQSLDGHIATDGGDSSYVTGRENIVHLHRMRALSDAVVVGAGTVHADDPRLTTRLVSGANPVRVVLDPQRRLPAGHRVFSDGAAPTLVICSQQAAMRSPVTVGQAEVLGIATGTAGLALETVLETLRQRDLRVVFVEGGGATVSAFLAAKLLARLQIAIAPVLIGSGRPGIRLPAVPRLADCMQPGCRVFRMGRDVLFDCDLSATRRGLPAPPSLARIV